MASKLGLAGGMPERRVRPIWDAVDSRQFKTALKLSTALLAKYPNSPYALALKALILERIGRLDEALSVCLEAKELLYLSNLNMVPIDDLTLSTLQIVFQRLDRLDLATSCYEHACGKFPSNLELLMGLFNCYVREYSFVKQQQTAIKLYKIVAEERFLLWAICSIQLQVLCSSGGEKLLSLAEALLKKHIASHSLHEPEAVVMYISILEQQAKYDEALEIISGNLGSLIGIEVDKLRLQGRLLARACNYAAASEIYQKILESRPDDWGSFLNYLGCLLGTDFSWSTSTSSQLCSSDNVDFQGFESTNLSLEVFDSRIQNALSFVQKMQMEVHDGLARCPYLASIEIGRQCCLRGKADAMLLEALLNYFRRFGHLACFASDLDSLSLTLTHNEKTELLGRFVEISESSAHAPLKRMGQAITIFKLKELFGFMTMVPVEELEETSIKMVDMYCKNLALSSDLDPQENMHGEELLHMASSALVMLYWRTRYFGYLLEAILVLEFGLNIRKYVWQYKFSLVHLYSYVNALPLAYEWYGTLDIKNILFETVSHHIVPQLLVSPLCSETSALLKDYLKFMDDYLREAADLTFLAYRHRNYSKSLSLQPPVLAGPPLAPLLAAVYLQATLRSVAGFSGGPSYKLSRRSVSSTYMAVSKFQPGFLQAARCRDLLSQESSPANSSVSNHMNGDVRAATNYQEFTDSKFVRLANGFHFRIFAKGEANGFKYIQLSFMLYVPQVLDLKKVIHYSELHQGLYDYIADEKLSTYKAFVSNMYSLHILKSIHEEFIMEKSSIYDNIGVPFCPHDSTCEVDTEINIMLGMYNRPTLEEAECILEKLDFGMQLLELSSDKRLNSLTFNEDLQLRPWWSPSSHVNYLSEPFEGASVCSRENLFKHQACENDGLVRKVIARKSLVPRLIYLSIHSTSTSLKETFESNAPGEDAKSNEEFKFLLEKYASSVGLSFDDAVKLIYEISNGQRSLKDVDTELMVDFMNFAVFLNAWNLSHNHPLLLHQNGVNLISWNVVECLIKYCISELLMCAHPVLDNPGSSLPVLVQLITEPFSWHALVIQSCLRSMLPSGKKKKKSGPCDHHNLRHLAVVSKSIDCLASGIQEVHKWLEDQMNCSEDSRLDILSCQVKEMQKDRGPGSTLHILEEFASSSHAELGENISGSLQLWNSTDVLRKLLSSQSSLLLKFQDICAVKLKMLELMKLSF
ncbi:N-terminal acetyltransferase B complex auxiliary subunit NAA25 [Phalaenopsis equestris]|uniref:N-terminal acetyltransferase B complex auxiliary subunit NAA25 n=1 Tax=Phalaenopsis equestris TaxID=78828 RepID=UPI0009E2FD70|nr:N-terminal acetyltransferase B complex auxiliary subunit NAA25 [Phalaenopsis equestris]